MKMGLTVLTVEKGGLLRDAISLAQSLAKQAIGEDTLSSAQVVLEGKGLCASPFGQFVHPEGNLLGRVVVDMVVDENHGAKLRIKA